MARKHRSRFGKIAKLGRARAQKRPRLLGSAVLLPLADRWRPGVKPGGRLVYSFSACTMGHSLECRLISQALLPPGGRDLA